MSDIYVGLKAQSIDIGAEMPDITGIRLVVDSDHEYVVGDAAGRMIEVECPWGTEDMAKSILETMSGMQYRSYTAERAMLDPAFEPGDAINIGGVSSVIINSDINYNGAGLANIDAPALDEIDDEYPAQQTQKSRFERQIAYTRSLITKTANEIKLAVEAVDKNYTELKITLEGVTVTDQSGTTLIKGSSIDTSTLNVDNINLTGKIVWGDLSTGVQDDINDAYTMAEDAEAAVTLITIVEDGYTYIDGSMIYSESIYADALHLGGDLTIYKRLTGSTVGGNLGFTTSSLDGSAGMHMLSAGGLGEVVVTDNGAKMMYGDENNQIYTADGNASVVVDGCWFDFYDDRFLSENYADLGSASYPWSTLYADTCECCPSDRRLKTDIEDLPEKYVQMIARLTPRRFRLLNGASGRYHVGYISQEVEEAMTACGISSLEFGGFVQDWDKDGNKVYMLRYSEFIGILTAKVQAMQKEIDTLKERIS